MEIARQDVSGLLDEIVVHVVAGLISESNEVVAIIVMVVFFPNTENFHPSSEDFVSLLLQSSSVQLFLVPGRVA